jgi:hypothetical protein
VCGISRGVAHRAGVRHPDDLAGVYGIESLDPKNHVHQYFARSRNSFANYVARKRAAWGRAEWTDLIDPMEAATL